MLLVDGEGGEVAAVIVGNARLDASGLGKSCTYVRRPGDAQAWLANMNIDAGVEFANWVRRQLFETIAAAASAPPTKDSATPTMATQQT